MSMCVRAARALLMAALAVGLMGSGCSGSGSSGAGRSSTGSSSPSSAAAPGGLEQVPAVAAKLQPSVVTVLPKGGVGSGVIYTPDGLILTNEHVVRGNRTVRIAFADGRQAEGTVTASDPVTDLALVQADRRNLPPARFQTRCPRSAASPSSSAVHWVSRTA